MGPSDGIKVIRQELAPPSDIATTTSSTFLTVTYPSFQSSSTTFSSPTLRPFHNTTLTASTVRLIGRSLSVTLEPTPTTAEQSLQTSTTSTSHYFSQTSIVVGIVVGTAAGFALIFVCFALWSWRRDGQKRKQPNFNAEPLWLPTERNPGEIAELPAVERQVAEGPAELDGRSLRRTYIMRPKRCRTVANAWHGNQLI
jgi:hypothetical protein